MKVYWEVWAGDEEFLIGMTESFEFTTGSTGMNEPEDIAKMRHSLRQQSVDEGFSKTIMKLIREDDVDTGISIEHGCWYPSNDS